MSDDTTPKDLPNKPLREAIFDIRWGLHDKDDQAQQDKKVQYDKGFNLLVGVFFNKVNAEYGEVVNLPATQIPEDMAPYIVRHQFKSKDGGWPLIQLGPGILTFNETQKYSWPNFKEQLESTVTNLYDSYPVGIAEFSPIQLSLKYINAIPLDEENKNLLDLISSDLHTEIQLDESLFGENIQKSPTRLSLDLAFPLDDPKGKISLTIASGKMNKKSALIFQFEVTTDPEGVPGSKEEIFIWIEKAHKIIENWFFSLIRGKLHDSYIESSE